jgi:glutathione S-transferase
MNLKARFPGFKVWTRAQDDIDRITALWRECIATYGGSFLFGRFSMADAMYAPVVTRFVTYDVKLDATCAAYAKAILEWPAVAQWHADAEREPIAIDELEVEF